MCGILGGNQSYWDYEEALKAISHRGPDNSKIHNDYFTLGFSRLSIIDLDNRAKQPMQVLDGSVTIVFNGEIYNYQKIKDDLLIKGYKFRTSGDTEVILNAYLEYGIECINDFIGCFTICVLCVYIRTI